MDEGRVAGEKLSATNAALRAGLEHERAGRLAEAEAVYRGVLTAQPNHAEACHLLGRLRHASGDTDGAVDFLRRAIRLDPGAAHYLKSLGDICTSEGRIT